METNQSAECVRGSSVIFESCRLSVDNLRKYSVNSKKPSCAWMFSNFLPKGSGDLTSMLLNYGLPSVCYIAFKVSYIFLIASFSLHLLLILQLVLSLHFALMTHTGTLVGLKRKFT